jgi:sulfonate transport system substrate-binding protein
VGDLSHSLPPRRPPARASSPTATGIVNNHEFYLASRDLVDRDPEAVATILEAIGEVDDWVNAHKSEVAAEFAPLIGIPCRSSGVAVDRRTYGVPPITPEVVAQQQAIADVFFDLGLIPKAIKISDALVEPQS